MIACVLLMLVAAAAAENALTVTQPLELRKDFKNDGKVNERPSLFGMPAYGRSMRGTIFWPTSVEDQLGCGEIKQKPTESMNPTPQVFLLSRGKCTFVSKVRHAQDAGATAVIVINGDNGPLPHMSNDGSGASIVIPSLIISKEDGDRLSNYAASHPDKNIEVSLEYGLPESEKYVDYTLWTSSMDPQAFEFKANFMNIAKQLEANTHFQAHYFFVNGKSYGCDTDNQICGNQCTNKGRYCAVDPDHDLSSGLSGADVVAENLRQICVYNVAKANSKLYLWWQYVNEFRTRCASVNTVNEACSKTAVSSVAGLDWGAVSQYVASSGGASAESDKKNELIEEELKKKEADGVYLLPTVMINNVTYYGSLSCPLPLDMAHCGVLKTICSAFIDGKEPPSCLPSKGCELGKTRDACDRCLVPNSSDFITDANDCATESGGVGVATVIGLIIVFVAILVGAAFVYHQHSSNRMRDELRNIMSQYVPLEGDQPTNERQRFV